MKLQHFLSSRCMVALALASALFGCSPSENKTEDPAQTLNVTIGTEPQSLDPHMIQGVPGLVILSGVIEPLVSIDPSTAKIVPAAAESWSISKDGLTFTFNLRKNAKWSNGDLVTASDFVFSWKRILSPKTGHFYAQDYYVIKGAEQFYTSESSDFSKVGIKALDDHTLEFTLSQPDPLFLKQLAHESSGPVHPKTVLAHGDIDDPLSKWTRPPNYVSNGPFNITRWDINKIIVLKKNPHYWDAQNVKLEKINAFTVENTATEERMFRAGQIDLTFGGRIPVDKIDTYQKENPNLIHIEPIHGTYFYLFNTTKPPFDIVDIRRAFAYSLNRDKIAEKIARAGQTPTTTLNPTYKNYNPSSPIEYNPKRALEFMASGGYESGANFPAFDLIYNTSEMHKKVTIAAQQMWLEHLGVKFSIQNMEWKVFLDARNNHNFSMSRAGSISSIADPFDFLQSFTTGHPQNDTAWSDEIFDRLVKQSKNELDQTKRYALLEKAEERLLDQAVVIPIFNYTQTYLKAPEVKGVVFNPKGRPNFKDMYIDENLKSAK